MAAPRSAPGIRSRPRPRWPRPSRAIAGATAPIRDTGKARYAIVQAEDEIASIGIVVGAGWNGARAFTCTSGPGISLMQEFLGLAYFAEIPAVIFDVQRGGPSTGMPTRTQQADILACAYASHGDTKHPLLFPEDPHECFEFGALAFDLADRLQTPIFVMLDLDIGMNEWLCRPFAWDDKHAARPRQGDDLRGAGERARISAAISTSTATASPTAPIPARIRRAARFFTRGTSRDRYARYSEEGSVYVDNMQRLLRKFETAKKLMPGAGAPRRQADDQIRRDLFRLDHAGDARGAGHARRAGHPSRRAARPRLPVLSDEVVDFIAAHEQVFVVEQNRDAQLRTLLINECGIDPAQLVPVLHYDGTPITARFITGEIAALLRRAQGRAARGRSRDDLYPQAQAASPDLPTNALGFTRRDYEGSVSTLCAGCGHDSISAAIIQACFELDLPPHRIAKLSGIGCSSKTPDYFLGTCARLQHRARPHAVGADRRQPRQPRPDLSRRLRRRRLRLDRPRPVRPLDPARREHGLYRREQRRLRPDQGPVLGHLRQGLEEQARRDQLRQRRSTWSRMALQLGATFVARSFSGDKAQLVPLIKAALLHKGAAFIDCISPCVAFNNHAGSTKSFDYVREHNEAVNRLDVIVGREPITADYAPGTVEMVTQHDGSVLRLRKLAAALRSAPTAIAAMTYLQERARGGRDRHRPALCRSRGAGPARPSQHGRRRRSTSSATPTSSPARPRSPS